MGYAERTVPVPADRAVLGKDVLAAGKALFGKTLYRADVRVTERSPRSGIRPDVVTAEALEVRDCEPGLLPFSRSCDAEAGLRMEVDRWAPYDAVTVEYREEPAYEAAADLLEAELAAAVDAYLADVQDAA